jgi:hypothetical protein
VNSDGSLTQILGSPFATGDNGQNGTPFSLAVTTLKEKNYLYAANGADGTISGFRINPTTGKMVDRLQAATSSGKPVFAESELSGRPRQHGRNGDGTSREAGGCL